MSSPKASPGATATAVAPAIAASTTTTTTTTTAPPNATATLTMTASEPARTPFSPIIDPFREAARDSEARNLSFQKGDIALDKFTTALTGFLTIFDALGSPIITEIVRKDFRWKLNGLKNSARRLHADTVRDAVRKELASPPRFWAPSGIESLLWAHRILQFVEHLVAYMADDAALELRDACVRAYRATLAVRHPHMTKVVFEKALNLVPPRAQFIANLTGKDAPSEEDFSLALVGMKDFLRATRPVIEALQALFDREEIEDPHR